MAGHCDCMAGLGETCSPCSLPSMGNRMWCTSLTVTQKKAYWVIPNVVKEVPYAPVKDISLLERRRVIALCHLVPHHILQRLLLQCLLFTLYLRHHCRHLCLHHPVYYQTLSFFPPTSSCNEQAACTPSILFHLCLLLVPPPAHEEVNDFFESLASLSTKPAILSLVEPYSSQNQ